MVGIKTGLVQLASTLTPTQVLGVNPGRKRLIVSVAPGTTVYVGPDAAVKSTTGTVIQSNGAVGGMMEVNAGTELWALPAIAATPLWLVP